MADKEEILADEEQFHNEWASCVDVSTIDVRTINEALTAPEMRYITNILTDLKFKRLLDIGCGLGEAGVYFALKGAEVTVADLSESMVNVARRLAISYNVKITTLRVAAECIQLPEEQKFDVIYAGNLFHHVDIAKTLTGLCNILKPDGILVSWDPIAYNPLINVYRRIASKVRTQTEHPLTLSDINLFKTHFRHVKIRYFWLSTLVIFIIMAVFQLRNPNKERYWKKIVEESDRWAPIYRPLELLDGFLLETFPFLGPLCWNVVIHASEPINNNKSQSISTMSS